MFLFKTNVTSKAAAEISGVIKQFESFEFVLLTVIWYDVLKETNFVSKALQKKDIHMEIAVVKLEGLHTWIKDYRKTGFVKSMIEAKRLAQSWSEELGIDFPTSFPEGQGR